MQSLANGTMMLIPGYPGNAHQRTCCHNKKCSCEKHKKKKKEKSDSDSNSEEEYFYMRKPVQRYYSKLSPTLTLNKYYKQ